MNNKWPLVAKERRFINIDRRLHRPELLKQSAVDQKQ